MRRQSPPSRPFPLIRPWRSQVVPLSKFHIYTTQSMNYITSSGLLLFDHFASTWGNPRILEGLYEP